MVARRPRPVETTDDKLTTPTKASETGPDVLPQYDEHTPHQQTTPPLGAHPTHVVVLDSERETSDTDANSVQVMDPALDDSGYNADAEDANDNINDVHDENDEDHYVEDKTDNEHASPTADAHNSYTDEPFSAGQSEPESHDTGGIEDTLEEQISDGEDSRDVTDHVETTVTQPRNFEDSHDRLSDAERSDEDAEERESPQERTDLVQNADDFIDEGDESLENADGEQLVTGSTEDPREEQYLSEEQDDGSENEETMQPISQTVNSGRTYSEVHGTGVRLQGLGDPTSPGENEDVTDATKERASEGEESSGSDDVAQPTETADDDNQSSDEFESEIIESEDQANDEEPHAGVDSNSDMGERAGEERSDREERVEFDDTSDIPVEKIEEEASESEEEDDDLREEGEDSAEEAGDPNLASSDIGDSYEGAENGSMNQEAGQRSNESSDEMEKVEEDVNPDNSDDDDNEDQAASVAEPSDEKAIADSGDSSDEGSVENVITDQTPTSGISTPDERENAEEQVWNGESDEDDFEDEEESGKGQTGSEKGATGDGDEDGSDYMEDSDDDDVNTREYEQVPPRVRATTAPDRSAAKDIESASKGSKETKSQHDSENGSNNGKRKVGHVEPELRNRDSKSGVIYLPRVPPGLDVTALRSLLSRITQPKRIWLRPETKEQRRRRQSLGGSRRKERFRDGWVEVQTSKEARRVVGLLNGRPMTAGKRKGRWAEDLWCLKYLKGFGWDDLTKEVFGGRERVLRVRESVMQGRRERAWIEGRGKGRGERVRRFRQKRALEDSDDIRAREAGERADAAAQNGGGGQVDRELAGMLFKRRKT